MARGRKHRSSAASAAIGLTAGSVRAVSVLPDVLVASLKTEPVPKPRAPRPSKPPVVGRNGTVSAEGLAVLASLAEQMDRQVAANDWNGSRVPNGMLEAPEGMSGAQYRKLLTPLRAAGLVQARNGMWWVLPKGRKKLAQQAS
jgi:hypothetical protein